MDTIIFALEAVFPIIILIFLGYYLKRQKFLDDIWFKNGNKLIFRLFVPCLLFINVYNIDSFTNINWSAVLFSEIAIVLVFFIGIVVVKMVIKDDKQKGVVLQCIFRSNFAIIGLPLAEALGGIQGKGVAAVISAFSVPTFNILSVLALSFFVKNEDGRKVGIKNVFHKIVTNPLIIGVVCGLIALLIRSLLPKSDDGQVIFSISKNVRFIYVAIENIAKACSTIALMVLGGQLDFKAVRGMKQQIIIGALSRVVIVPGIVLGVAVLLSEYLEVLSFDASIYPALVALFGSPVAVVSAVTAQEMGSDGALAGQLVVWTSVLSIFTLFFFVLVLRLIGVL